MAEGEAQPAGPDLTLGISAGELPDGGKLAGHVGNEAVLLVRRGAEVFAIGAQCTHYSGPLAEGLIVEGAVRCPWHHACFDLRTGEALRAPALSPVDTWRVEQRDGKIFVREKRARPEEPPRQGGRAEENCDRRRRRGGVRRGRDAAAAEIRGRHRHAEQRRRAACRPAQPVKGLSRRQRAGGMAAAARPGFLFRQLHRPSPQHDRRRDRCGRAKSRSPTARRFPSIDCFSRPAPSRWPFHPGRQAVGRARASLAQRLPRRSSNEQRRRGGRSSLGASFIGLEVAASLRARNVEVHVVAPEERPMEKILGPTSAASCKRFTSSTALSFICATRRAAWTASA